MKVLFDINVVLDVWGMRKRFVDSYKAMDIALVKHMEVCVTASMMPALMCVAHSSCRGTREEQRDLMADLLGMATVLDVTAADCTQAAQYFSGDYEDDLIVAAALRHGVDFIVTNDKAGFKSSQVPVMTPADFVSLYQPTCIEYREVRIDELRDTIEGKNSMSGESQQE